MKSSAKKVELASVDDLFSTEESRADAQREKVVEIPLSEPVSYTHLHDLSVVAVDAGHAAGNAAQHFIGDGVCLLYTSRCV